jgi:hypothetical protein
LNVEQAQQILSTLEAKLVAVTAQATGLQTLRRKLSFDANTGDAKARKALDDANAAFATAALEIENTSAAVEEAKRRLSEAGRAEEMERQRENGAAAVVIADRIAERGRKLDATFAIAREELEGFKADLDALHLLGLANPRAEQFRVLGGLALTTALMGLPIKAERDHLAPRERHSFTEICTGWREQIVRWADGLVGKEAA